MTDDEAAVILIAEDDPLASMALQAQVEALGHTVAGVARDGGEAAAMTRCLPADLAIFDMKMPRRTGIDVAVEIFPAAPTPVLLLTGFGAADLPDPVPEPPIFALLTKPIGLTELRQGIDRALARFQQWLVTEDTEQRVRDSRDERRDIQRVLARTAGDQPTAAAAARFIERAEAEHVSPAELARRILRSDPEA